MRFLNSFIKKYFMLSQMKLFTYIFSLGLAFLFYRLFSRYLVYEDVLTTGSPYIIFYGALVLFGFLSWFHFYKPKLGAIFLTIIVALMFLVWVILLLGPHLKNFNAPHLYESGLLLIESAVTIILVWNTKGEDDINRYIKLLLSAAPFAYVVYLFIIYSNWSN
jgi:amino acid transporter